MKLVRPVTISGAMLISSTLAEPSGSDPAAWSGATTYALGDQRYLASTHRIYQSLQGSNLNHSPDVSPTWWAELYGTNKWAMFDNGVSSASSGSSPLTVVFDPGTVNSLVLLGCIGDTATVTITDTPGGTTIYSKTIDLQAAAISDWYAYFVEAFRQVSVVVMTDIPAPYPSMRVTVSITGSGTVACGACIPGRTYDIGGTQYGVEAGIRDYSRKVTDETTGIVTLEQRKFAKTLRANIRTEAAIFNEVHEQLELLRATPCVWVADNTGDAAPLTVYGFYRDFSLVVDFPSHGVYRLEVEGLV